MKNIVSTKKNLPASFLEQSFQANKLYIPLFFLAVTLAFSSQSSGADSNLRARIAANLSGAAPHWLGHPSKSQYAKLIVSRYQQSEHTDSIEELLLESPWPQYSALFSHYIQYRLLNDSGYWCADSHSEINPELAAYLLWLQGDLLNEEVTLGGLSSEVCSVRQVTVAHSTAPDSEVAKLLPQLQAALIQFQKRFGLPASGKLDAQSVSALRLDAEWMERRLRTNLLRMATLDNSLGERYLIANIPAFQVSVFERYKSVLTLKAIVGKTSRPTPQFSSELSSVVLNPGWNVPPKIAHKDLIPKQIKQADYLSKRNIAVYADWTSKEQIDPATIDWPSMLKDFPYRMKQAPGPNNALGKVKFVTPNSRAIYLHDTNAKTLFQRADRALSSGCVRLEHPERLARYVLESQYTNAEIESLLHSGNTRAVKVRETLPVHYVYWTSWVNDDGVLQHSQDIYDLDSNGQQIETDSPSSTLAYGIVRAEKNATATKS